MNKYIIALVTVLTIGCGQEEIEDPVPVTREVSFCDYDIEGICVTVEDRFMIIDPEFLSWALVTLEYEVNFFYPGLNLSDLAEEHELRLEYRWANRSTTAGGTYSTNKARVNLRQGDNITPLMECNDRYYIAQHEVLHFIVNKYLLISGFKSQEDAHNIEYIFKTWGYTRRLAYRLYG